MKRNTDSAKPLTTVIILVILVFPFFYLRKMAEPSLGARWIVLNLISVILPLYWLLKHYLTNKKIEIRLNSLHFILLVVLVWLAVSGFWAVDRATFTQNMINLLSVSLLIFFLSSVAHQIIFRYIINAFVIAVFLISVLGLMQYYGFLITLYGQTAPPAAGFVNKNLATATVAILFPYTYISFLGEKDNKKKYFYITAFTLSLGYLIAAATRSAWLAAFLSGIIVFICLLWKYQKVKSLITKGKVLLFIIAIIVALVIFWLPVGMEIENNITRPAQEQIVSMFEIDDLTQESDSVSRNSVNLRLVKWRNGLEIFKSKPLAGVGLGNFDAYYPLFHKAGIEDRFYDDRLFLGKLHNEPLQLIVETGAIGFLLIALFTVTIVVFLIRLIRFSDSPEILKIIAVFAGLIALVVDSCFNYSFHFPTALFFFGILLGFTLNFVNRITRSYLISISSGLGKTCLIILFLILTIVGLNIASRKYSANVLHRQALSYDSSGYHKKAATFSYRAAKKWPNQNMFLFHAVRINVLQYINRKSSKNFRTAEELLETGLKNMPYNYLVNYANFQLALSSRSKSRLEKLVDYVHLLEDITPYNRIYHANQTISEYYKIMGDHELELDYFVRANLHAGNAYFKSQDFVKALKYYRKLLDRDLLPEELKARYSELVNISDQ